MIKTENLTKRFDKFTALDSVNMQVETGSVFGLVGSNGAGKSTLLRIISGVLTANSGQVTIDDVDINSTISARENLVFVPDTPYFLPGANLKKMAKLCKNTRAKFNYDKYNELTAKMEADIKKPVVSMSKGMKRQAALILAMASMPDVLLIDETFDGLDVIKRHIILEEIYSAVEERKMTVVLASHSLHEIETICDSIAMLHKGRIMVNSELDEAKEALLKVQIAFNGDFDQSAVSFEGCKIISFTKDGAVASVVYENEREVVERELSAKNPVLLNVVPLSLEETFIYKCGQ